MISNLIGLLSGFLIFVVVIIPFASLLATLRAIGSERYLNSYFVVSKKGDFKYELHHQPALGLYVSTNRKFYKKMHHAINEFQNRFPESSLSSITLTQQSRKRSGEIVQMNRVTLLITRLMTDFLILCNLAVYRRISGQWQFIGLIQNVHQNKMLRYSVVNK